MGSESLHQPGVYLVPPSKSPTLTSTRIGLPSPRHIPELRTWAHLPHMGRTAETGPKRNADDDELAHDDDVDQEPSVKRRRTQPPLGEGSDDLQYSMIDIDASDIVRSIQPSSSLTRPIAFDIHESDTSATHLALDDGPHPTFPSPSTAKLEDVQLPYASSPLKIKILPRQSTSTLRNHKLNTSSISGRELLQSSAHTHAQSLALPESISASTSSSLVPSGSFPAHLRPQIARKLSSSYAAVTGSNGYEATMEEIETWTHANVSPLVFGQKKYVQLPKSDDITAMNLRMLCNPGSQSEISESSTPSPNLHAWREVAVPAVSRSARRTQLFQNIFGIEGIVPSYATSVVARIGNMSRKSNMSQLSTDTRLHDANSPDFAETSDGMTSESSNLRPTKKISYSPLMHKTHAFGFTSSAPQLTGSSTVFTDRSTATENHLYPLGEDTASGLQPQHSPRSDFSDVDISSSDDGLDQKSPQLPASEHGPPPSPTLHVPNLAHLSPEQNVVELISPMVLELHKSAHDEIQPDDSFSMEQIFTLNPNSALAMPNDPSKSIKLMSPSHSKSVAVQESLDILDIFQDTKDFPSFAIHNDHSSQAPPSFGYSATHSPGNTLAADLPPTKISGTVAAGLPTSVENISSVEEELRPHTPIPTIFDPEFSKSRPRDLWAQDQHGGLHYWVNEKTVIGQIREDLDARYFSMEGEGDEIDEHYQDEEEVDEVDSDHSQAIYDEDGESIRTPSKPTKMGHFSQSRAKSELQEPQLPQIEEPVPDVPRDLARQMEIWDTSLRSLVKGKKRFQEHDVIGLKDALQGIYDNHKHISPTSSIANSVYTITSMRAGDIPGEDKIGLRALARKSVRAWGSRPLKPQQEK